MNNAFSRLWRIPLRYALWLALPLQLIMFWVGHRGWVQYERAMSFAAPPTTVSEKFANFSVERWRYFTRQELRRSFYRAMAPKLVADDLEFIELMIDGGHLGELNRDLPESGRTTFFPAVLNIGGRSERVKTRYMGDNHWHWLYPQKSWKVKTKAGNPIRNRRLFNLKNPPTIGVFEDEIASDLAKDLGLISPAVHPVKMLVNGVYAGLYLWWDIADESLLRRYRRMPGSIYSGDGAPFKPDGTCRLFLEEQFWKKDGARNAESAADRRDIQMLIRAINDESPQAFRAFADDHISLPQFGRFTALDRLLGGQHHDYSHNHKLYFDPYKGKFEPIEWDFAFWRLGQRKPGLDQSLNPLLLRVRQQPEYELAIQRELNGLTMRVTPERMEKRIRTIQERIRPALEADGFRDARLSGESSKMRLPREHCAFYSNKEFDENIDRHIERYGLRHSWLGRRLSDSVLKSHLMSAPGTDAVLSLQSSGLVGQLVEEIVVTTAASTVSLIEDRNRNSKVDDGERVVAQVTSVDGVAKFDVNELLLPGLKKVSRGNEFVKLYGKVDLVPAPLDYRYIVQASGAKVEAVAVKASNAVNGKKVDVEVVAEWTAAELCWSCHPWDIAVAPEPRTVVIGPGHIVMTESVRFGPETTVVVKPGTNIKLASDVSIEFQGKVLAEGREDAPIRFDAVSPDRPWGVFALHGQATSGSRFLHCEWRNGSKAELRAVARTGMVSIIDTKDLVMANCFIGRNFVGDDALHWGYLTGAQIRDCKFEGANSDAFDIDISEQILIERCHFVSSGNDSVDLMTSKVTISNCVFDDAGDKGVSVGESSRLELLDSRLNRCHIGIEIKDGSFADVDSDTAFVGCTTGVNLFRKNPRYSEGGTLVAGELSIIGSQNTITKDKRSTVNVKRIITTKD